MNYEISDMDHLDAFFKHRICSIRMCLWNVTQCPSVVPAHPIDLVVRPVFQSLSGPPITDATRPASMWVALIALLSTSGVSKLFHGTWFCSQGGSSLCCFLDSFKMFPWNPTQYPSSINFNLFIYPKGTEWCKSSPGACYIRTSVSKRTHR